MNGDTTIHINAAEYQSLLESDNWLELRSKFKETGDITLSDNLLTQRGEHNTWPLLDLDNKRVYEIIVGGEIEIRSFVEGEQGDPLNAEGILTWLTQSSGTTQGVINLVKRFNVNNVNVDGLQRSELSSIGLDFEYVYKDLLIVHAMLQKILGYSCEQLRGLSRGQIEQIRSCLIELDDYVNRISQFEIGDGNIKQKHQELVKDALGWVDPQKELLNNIIAYLYSGKHRQLESQLVDLEGRYGALIGTGEQAEMEREQTFGDLVRNFRDVLAEKSVSRYTNIFSTQADKHRKSAKKWLIATGAFTIVFLAFVYVAFVLPQLKGDVGNGGWVVSLRDIFTKALLLPPIYVWINRSIKNYTAQTHLEVINTHRQTALETFDAFVAAAEGNQETRDAVLLAATEAIFDANQTGYLTTKGLDTKSPMQQMIKLISPKTPTGDG